MSKNLDDCLASLQHRRRVLTSVPGDDLVATWSMSGAFTIRPRVSADVPDGPLFARSRLHYGGQGWGCSWCHSELGDLLVFSSGAFVVRRLDDAGHARYWQEHRIAPDPNDFLEDLIDRQP